ncbi:hypothetical protein M1512_02875 [Patescibacteria group bacterium]|nr:hypothetical protein [Patescibacteria group bacterium]
MYSGTTFTKASGIILGAHQKIDRLAYRHVSILLQDKTTFPTLKQILHFEGYNGPDAIKRKSPSKDEPWHFFMPFDEDDTELLSIISSHYNRLVVSLRQQDLIRSAFEAAWLAHAIVDGLTPAHHYPYAEKLAELKGKRHVSTSTLKDKLLFPGATLTKSLVNNWKFWGPKGLFMTHASFEMGVATLIRPIQLTANQCIGELPPDVSSMNLSKWFRSIAQQIDNYKMYDEFYAHGWSRSLAKQIRRDLIPVIVGSVILVWRGAASEAGLGLLT